MLVSVLVDAEGVNPNDFYPCDSYINHIKPDERHKGLDCDVTFLPNGESDYEKGLWGETAEKEDEGGKSKVYNIKVTGVVPFSVAMDYLDHIGAAYEDVETMGTLGGPANPIGWAPDTSWNVESRLVVACIRVTPFVPTEASWERVKRLFKEYDAYELSKMGSKR